MNKPTPRYIRTASKASTSEGKTHSYSTVEYDLVTGRFRVYELKSTQTNMRMNSGAQFEFQDAYAHLGWAVVSKEQFNQAIEEYKQARIKNGYTGEFPIPTL